MPSSRMQLPPAVRTILVGSAGCSASRPPKSSDSAGAPVYCIFFGRLSLTGVLSLAYIADASHGSRKRTGPQRRTGLGIRTGAGLALASLQLTKTTLRRLLLVSVGCLAHRDNGASAQQRYGPYRHLAAYMDFEPSAEVLGSNGRGEDRARPGSRTVRVATDWARCHRTPGGMVHGNEMMAIELGGYRQPKPSSHGREQS
jgi:hypothetical protein